MTHPPPMVIGLGEVLWDCFPDGRRPGGAPANVAFHANQLGARGVVCSRVGEDELGRELLTYLHDNGLNTTAVQHDAEHATGTVTVHTDSASAPSYTIHEEVAWDYMTLTPQWGELFAEANAVCFGTLAQRCEQSRETIQACLKLAKKALIVYDINLRPPHFDEAWIRESLERSDVTKLNIDEQEMLYHDFGIGAAGHEDFAEAILREYGHRLVCITRGSDGCYLVTQDDKADVEGIDVTVSDAVGAGDAFTAALTVGLIEGWPLKTLATFANRVGATIAQRKGGMPPLAEDYMNLREELLD